MSALLWLAFRRDTIVTRGDAQAKIAARTKSKDKTVTKGTFQRQLAELRKKIKTTIQVKNDDPWLGQVFPAS